MIYAGNILSHWMKAHGTEGGDGAGVSLCLPTGFGYQIPLSFSLVQVRLQR